jgi:hypothetical protein
VAISGAWPASDTSWGFAPAVGAIVENFGMNAGCITYACRATIGGTIYVAADVSFIHWPDTAPAGSTQVFLYLVDGVAHFGVNASGVPSGTYVYGGVLDLNVSAAPTSSTHAIVPMAYATVTATGSTASFGSVVTYAWPGALVKPHVVPDPIIIID